MAQVPQPHTSSSSQHVVPCLLINVVTDVFCCHIWSVMLLVRVCVCVCVCRCDGAGAVYCPCHVQLLGECQQ